MRTGFALASAPAGHALTQALALAPTIAAHKVPALVAEQGACCAMGTRTRDRTTVWHARSGPWPRSPRSSGRIGWSADSEVEPPSATTTPAVVALVVAGVFAVGRLGGPGRHTCGLEYVCKPADLVALIATAVARPGP